MIPVMRCVLNLIVTCDFDSSIGQKVNFVVRNIFCILLDEYDVLARRFAEY